MSQISKGILAAGAVALSLGAAQFAAGEDLTVGMRATGVPDQGVNRAAKTDRAPVVAELKPATRTVAIHVDRFPDTSILVRIPRDHEARSSTPPQLELKGERKMAVACEPVVSVLTEIAKRLEPGRCVT
jgi:outer membrane scaffolding protein for murein synthesis (MipA/OmpV family)